MLQCKEGKMSNNPETSAGTRGLQGCMAFQSGVTGLSVPTANFWYFCFWHLAEVVFQEREPAREGASALLKAPFRKHRRKQRSLFLPGTIIA